MPTDSSSPRSPFWLAVRVLDEPVAVFHELANRPRALVPVILLVCVSALTAFGTPRETLERAAQAQVQALRRVAPDRFTEADEQRILGNVGSVTARATTFAAQAAAGLVVIVIVAAVLKLIFGTTSGVDIRFADEFSIAAHAYMPQLVGLVLAVALMAFMGIDRPEFSLGFLFDDRTSFLGVFTRQLTLFGAWNVYLLAVGNQIKTKQESIGGVLGLLAALWILLKLAFAGVTTMFLP
jgi:hypothetical protein